MRGDVLCHLSLLLVSCCLFLFRCGRGRGVKLRRTKKEKRDKRVGCDGMVTGRRRSVGGGRKEEGDANRNGEGKVLRRRSGHVKGRVKKEWNPAPLSFLTDVPLQAGAVHSSRLLELTLRCLTGGRVLLVCCAFVLLSFVLLVVVQSSHIAAAGGGRFFLPYRALCWHAHAHSRSGGGPLTQRSLPPKILGVSNKAERHG
jgi:hypothetical protein